MGKVILKCDNIFCGKEFTRLECEVRRNGKLNRATYCSRRCQCIHMNTLKHHYGDIASISKLADIAVLSFMLETLNGCRKRADSNNTLYRKNAILNIELSDLINQWNKQNGICTYSKVKLIPNKNTSFIYKASLDRIDSSKGYEIGNIQFISTAMNLMKNTMSHDEVLKLLDIIRLT